MIAKVAASALAALGLIWFAGTSLEPVAPAAQPVVPSQAMEVKALVAEPVKPAPATKTETGPAPKPKVTPQPKQSCNSNYSGCLKPDASDYDCAGGSGNGPYYTGAVQVIGYDEYDLDRDGDGWACE